MFFWDIELLKYAKSLSDYLIVAIDTDKKVAEMKGSTRPIFATRQAMMLKSIRYVDVVHMFDSKLELEELLDPLVRYNGGSSTGKVKKQQVHIMQRKFGFDRLGDYSTTKTIQGITYR